MLATLSAVSSLVTMNALADTNSTSTDTDTSTVTSTQNTDMQMMEQGGNGFMGGHGGRGHDGSMSNVEVSEEYNATVTAILENDADVANLISEGYTVTSIHPIIKTVVEGDGTVATTATTAKVTMTSGTTGYATINVDITNAQVTYITIVTKTVIDKTSS
ncbi:MAG: hypothetical protein NWE92_12225 [Candidatus Bathyarchaeota archaeon]|nr:hypothetical protein [Candidatus Bathyarchaeota archaeon]